MPVELTDRFLRVRVRSPSSFKENSFRTHDIGRDGHTKRIAGISKKEGKWKTQSWLIDRKDLKNMDARAWNLLIGVLSDNPRLKPSAKKALEKII